MITDLIQPLEKQSRLSEDFKIVKSSDIKWGQLKMFGNKDMRMLFKVECEFLPD